MKTIEPGTTFDGKYEIEAVLGSGGVGTVYKALETDLNRPVAIKILHIWTSSIGEPDSLQRFKREAKVLCQLLHPNILRVYRFGMTETDLPFLVMEYAKGESLRSLLEKNGPIEYNTVTKIALKLAAALEHSHAHGIVHRDLKPENVIVDLSDPNDPMVKLIDFGLCKPEQKTNSTNQRTLTSTGDLLGTALYMSPEQVLGQPVTERADIYAFALVLFEMIVGKGPFAEGNVAEIMMRRTTEQIPEILQMNPSSGLPRQLDQTVQACGARELGQRLQSFTEVIEMLGSVPATTAGARFQPGGKSLLGGKKKLPLIIGVAFALISGVGALVYLSSSDNGSGNGAAVKMPSEVIKTSIAEVEGRIQKKDLKGALEIARNSTKHEFEQWPASQRADLLYSYFEIFKQSGDKEAANEFLPRFFKAALPMLFKKDNEPPEWRARVKACYDYLHSEKQIDRTTWRAISTALTSDGSLRKNYKGDVRTRLLLKELSLDAEFRIWPHPQPTHLSDYTKRMVEFAKEAGQYKIEDLYQYYYTIAHDLSIKHGFKRFEVLAAEAACAHALAQNDVTEAAKQMDLCRQLLKQLDQMPDSKELKSSSRHAVHEMESKVELALAEEAEAKGDSAAALKHRELAQRAAELSVQFEKLARDPNKPSLKGMVIDQFDNNK
ncbi:MAG: serine/threonine protein kinase [Candidatus Obscuribacterales bacterium]|jgi:serine/threonine protein kinase|nr:serine/threonine protein kinase [Candidatus Obscuribacterales bacterium]